jgi:hypothetical protein
LPQSLQHVVCAYGEPLGEPCRRRARLVEPDGLDDLFLIETTLAGGDLGPTEVSRHRASVDAEPGGELLHRLACLVAGDQGVDLGGLEGSSGPRFGPWNLAGGVGLFRYEALRATDIQFSKLA